MESLFTFLNSIALTGWSLVLCILLASQLSSSLPILSSWTTPFFEPSTYSSNQNHILLIDMLILLEGICFIEVGRIAMGQLKGNLVLGVVLHIIRMSCLLLVLPNGIASSSATIGDDSNNQETMLNTLVLYSWALTEVGRYPMYLFPSSSKARFVRLVLPIATFPVGAFAEAMGAYWTLSKLMNDGGAGGNNNDDVDGGGVLQWVKIGLLGVVILVNSLLGPTLAYPALLKKGLPVLMGKGEVVRGDDGKKKA